MSRGTTALAVGVLLLAGGALGWGVSAGQAVEAAEQAPPGWTRAARPAPYMNPATLGALGVAPDAWMLGRYAALARDAPAEEVVLDVTLGEDGALGVLLQGGDPLDPQGPAVIFEAGQPPRGALLRAGQAPAPLACTGAPAPLGAVASIRVARLEDQLVAESGGEVLRCDAPASAGGLVLQAGLRRVHLRSIRVDGGAVPAPRGATSRVGAVLLGALAVLLGAGLQALALVALAGSGGARRGRGASHLRALAAAALPLLLCVPLAHWDTGPLREVLRMPALSLREIPVLVGIAPTLLAWVLHGSWHLARAAGRPAWATGLALSAGAGVAVGGLAGAGLAVGLTGVATLAAVGLRRAGSPVVSPAGAVAAVSLSALAASLVGLGAESVVSRLYLGLFGAAVGGLVWALSRSLRLRAYNLVSLVLVLLAFGALETAVRFTAVGPFWRGTDGVQAAGSTASLVAEFEALEAREATSWPEAGFPVAAPPKSAAHRVVALGGSSTAGAYQNTRLEEFYPARMAEELGPEVEVINQGVGGWNTLHLARFAETHLAGLQPDVVTVYTGVNEMVEVPVPYQELYAAWRGGQLRAGPSVLDDLRLFHGLRFVLRALRGSTVAVPPAHTQAHLETVAQAAGDAGARVLLLSEAVQPRPEALEPWWAAMRAVAARYDHVVFLHTAPELRPLGGAAFLDTNHLSDRGHRALAAHIVAELRRLGWVGPARGATLPDGARSEDVQP